MARAEHPAHDLQGRGVLITRPAAQAQALCRLVEAAGGRAIPFPSIAIEAVADTRSLRDLLARPWDRILFVSRNAVQLARPLFPEQQLPVQPRLAAIGKATAQALVDAGGTPDLVPTGRFDSESQLVLPQLQDLRGQRLLIVRGVGGRALLGETLAQRGAEVAYAEVYRRILPATDATPLLRRWREEVHLVTATSGEILENLVTLVGASGRELLIATPLVVVSGRTAEQAKQLGFERIGLAPHASDGAIVTALRRLIA